MRTDSLPIRTQCLFDLERLSGVCVETVIVNMVLVVGICDSSIKGYICSHSFLLLPLFPSLFQYRADMDAKNRCSRLLRCRLPTRPKSDRDHAPSGNRIRHRFPCRCGANPLRHRCPALFTRLYLSLICYRRCLTSDHFQIRPPLTMTINQTTSMSLAPGIYVPVVTFFQDTAAQELDIETHVRHIRVLAEAGVDGVVLQGSTGEAVALTREERKEVRSRRRCGCRLMACSSFAHRKRFLRRLATLGTSSLGPSGRSPLWRM